jgi:hypothetical protein
MMMMMMMMIIPLLKYLGKQEEKLRETRGWERASNNVDYVRKSGSRIKS